MLISMPHERRLISIEISGSGPDALDVALTGVRTIVQAAGGTMFDRQVHRELDLTHDDDVQRAAACVEPMRAAGLLNSDFAIRNLNTQDGQQHRLGESRDALDQRTLRDLDAFTNGECITSVPHLLVMNRTDLEDRGITAEKQAILHRALVASGMPEEFPWPCGMQAAKHIRAMTLIAPTFAHLPNTTKHSFADYVTVIDDTFWAKDRLLTEAETEQASQLYAEQHRQTWEIVGGTSST